MNYSLVNQGEFLMNFYLCGLCFLDIEGIRKETFKFVRSNCLNLKINFDFFFFKNENSMTINDKWKQQPINLN